MNELILVTVILILAVVVMGIGKNNKKTGVNPFCTKSDKNCKCNEIKNKGWLNIRKYCVDVYGVSEYCEYRQEPERPKIRPMGQKI